MNGSKEIIHAVWKAYAHHFKAWVLLIWRPAVVAIAISSIPRLADYVVWAPIIFIEVISFTAAYQLLSGAPLPRQQEATQLGMREFWGYAVISFLYNLAVGLVLFLALVPFFYLAYDAMVASGFDPRHTADLDMEFKKLLAFVGPKHYVSLLFAVLVGIYVSLRMNFVKVAYVIEHVHGWAAIKRSAELTRGRTLKLLGTIIIPALLFGALNTFAFGIPSFVYKAVVKEFNPAAGADFLILALLYMFQTAVIVFFSIPTTSLIVTAVYKRFLPKK